MVRKRRSRTVSRILFLPGTNRARGCSRTRRPRSGDDHSSSPAIAGGIKRPTRKPRTGRPSSASLFGLAPCGVLPAICLTADAVRSYRTFSPLPAIGGSRRTRPTCVGRVFSDPAPRAVYFLCHCPSSYPDRALPGALPCGVRTFLPGFHQQRSSGRLRRRMTEKGSSQARRRAIVWVMRRRLSKRAMALRIKHHGDEDDDDDQELRPSDVCEHSPLPYPSVSCRMAYCSSFL